MIVSEYVPVGVVELAQTVLITVAVGCAEVSVTVFCGENDAVSPEPSELVVRTTLPLKLSLDKVIFLLAQPPCGINRDVGFATMLIVGGGAANVTIRE